jgi:hypothetical protein
MTLTGTQSRQVGWLTAAAVAMYVGVRLLPTGTNLSHMDFRVTGSNVIEFCDPANPQFLPVVTVRSPVVFKATPAAPVRAGERVDLTLRLSTAVGKPIGPNELLVVHTRPLHLMVVDPSLGDYQHVHPEPTGTDGEWTVSFEPRQAGVYRLFADFTPAATARGLYASTDLEVPVGLSLPGGSAAEAFTDELGLWKQNGPVEFRLTASEPMRAGVTVDLKFAMRGTDGGPVPLEPVMDAFAHLVAFDRDRTGFAHLHPAEIDLSVPPDRMNPELTFRVTIPQAGRFVVWAQVNLAGEETYVPFWFNVAQ